MEESLFNAGGNICPLKQGKHHLPQPYIKLEPISRQMLEKGISQVESAASCLQYCSTFHGGVMAENVCLEKPVLLDR